MQLVVTEDPGSQRFELRADDETLGRADYTVDGQTVVVDHVYTEPQHRGNGFAAELMSGLLAQLRDSGRRVRPVCSYAVAYMQDHPDQGDLRA